MKYLMRYLIVLPDATPFLTEEFSSKDNWIEDSDMIVFDLSKKIYTVNGKNWQEIESDQL